MPPNPEPKRELGALKFPKVEDIFHDAEISRPEVEPQIEQGERVKRMEQSGGASSEKISENIASVSAPAVTSAVPKTPLFIEIESIMEENLREIYNQMPDEAKVRFRQEGEKTANEIQKLFQSFKATTKAVLDLLRKWLRLIPGINSFFLEQEAKIKADKIMAIKLSQFQKK